MTKTPKAVNKKSSQCDVENRGKSIRNEKSNKKNICNVNSAAIDNNTTDNIGQKMCCKNTP